MYGQTIRDLESSDYIQAVIRNANTIEKLRPIIWRYGRYYFDNEDSCEVFPNLFIGCSQTDYEKFDVIIKLNDDKPERELTKDQKLHRFYIDEDEPKTYDEKINSIMEIIDTNIKENKKVLVHCFAGMNRSFCVLGEYLNKYKNINVREYLCTLIENNWSYYPSEYSVDRLLSLNI